MKIFLDDTVQVKSLKRKWSNRMNKVWSATATAYDACLQQSPPETVQMYGGEIGKLFNIYIEESPALQITDKLVISSPNKRRDNTLFTIKSIKFVAPEFSSTTYTLIIGVKDQRSTGLA
jgi:hypothetical protein